MAYGNRRYDYGLRGQAETTRGRDDAPRRTPMGGRWPAPSGDRRMEPRTPRVTARYNRDYVYGARGEDNYPRNPNRFGGEWEGQIGGGEDMYRRPYTTIGGTNTFRGSLEPFRYDRGYGDFERSRGEYDRNFRRR